MRVLALPVVLALFAAVAPAEPGGGPAARAARVELRTIPRRPRAGEPVTVRLADRELRTQSRVKVCIEPGVGRGRCWRTQLGPAVSTIRLNAPRPGEWKVRVAGPG